MYRFNSWQVKKYSPHGNALEEENALGTKSTAKFGYNESVPVLIAQNASYNAVWFNSFEDKTAETNVVYGVGHAGNRSKILLPTETYQSVASTKPAGQFILDNQIKTKGLIAKLWVKMVDETILPEDILQANMADISTGGVFVKGIVSKVARVGEWSLIEVKFSSDRIPSSIPLNTYFSFNITNNAASNIYIDDIRVQPLDCQMNAYVYDSNNLRLLASIDDQNFALFYQYNGEGKLVRKIIETERGVKTISETQYNTPLK